MGDVLNRLLGEVHEPDEIEIIRNKYGRPTHFKGLNGKLWGWPCVPYLGDLKLFKALSVACCGHPALNDQEQEVFDAVYPILEQIFDSIDERGQEMLDTLVSDSESEWFYRKQFEISVCVSGDLPGPKEKETKE